MPVSFRMIFFNTIYIKIWVQSYDLNVQYQVDIIFAIFSISMTKYRVDKVKDNQSHGQAYAPTEIWSRWQAPSISSCLLLLQKSTFKWCQISHDPIICAWVFLVIFFPLASSIPCSIEEILILQMLPLHNPLIHPLFYCYAWFSNHQFCS